MLSLRSELNTNEYKNIVSTCFDKADFYSLRERLGGYDDEIYFESEDFIKAMSVHEIASIETYNWHGYYLVGRSPSPFKIHFYESNEVTKKMFITQYNNMFMENSNGISSYYEDICFFKNRKLFLGTISHEDMCNFFPFSEDLQTQITMNGSWQEMESHPDYQTELGFDFMPLRDSSFLRRNSEERRRKYFEKKALQNK